MGWLNYCALAAERAAANAWRIVIAHSWQQLVVKFLTTTLTLVLAYAYTKNTAANDTALVSDEVRIVGLAVAASILLVVGLFVVQLFFVAPYQLWRDERAKAPPEVFAENGFELGRYLSERETFALWEAAGLLTGTPLNPNLTDGPAATVLLDLKRKMALGQLEATEDSGYDYPSWTPDRYAPSHTILQKEFSHGVRISRKALCDLADEMGVTIPGVTDSGAKVATLTTAEAGRWLYEHGSAKLREVLQSHVPELFPTIADHGAALVVQAATDGVCPLLVRWEAGLPLEEVDPSKIEFKPFERLFGSDKSAPHEVAVRRSDLEAILNHHQASR